MLYTNVFPIVLFRSTDEIGFQPVAAVGTGFTLGEGTFITCWHCVSVNLKEGEYYGIPYGAEMSLPNQVAVLGNIRQEPNRADLAVASIGIGTRNSLRVADRPAYWGRDVVALGFPHPENTVNPATGEPLIRTQSRALKGYVSTVGLHSTGGAREAKYYELGMPVPMWASGSPLFDAETLEVVGVLAGERTSQVGNSGEFTTGLALHLDVLRSVLNLAP